MRAAAYAAVALLGLILLFGLGVALGADARRYAAAGESAKVFAARMGITHGGCDNQSCSGLREGRPINYFCGPNGCAFDEGCK